MAEVRYTRRGYEGKMTSRLYLSHTCHPFLSPLFARSTLKQLHFLYSFHHYYLPFITFSFLSPFLLYLPFLPSSFPYTFIFCFLFIILAFCTTSSSVLIFQTNPGLSFYFFTSTIFILLHLPTSYSPVSSS